MTDLVFYLLVFLAVGVFFLFIHLVIGKLIRPDRPDAEKMTIYECGEPTVGSAWIQFDLRYYVVALLFVVFDVEVAFFFPWAVVFGKANQIAAQPGTKQELVRIDAELKRIAESLQESDLKDEDKKRLGDDRDRLTQERIAASEAVQKSLALSEPVRTEITRQLVPAELGLAYLEGWTPPSQMLQQPAGPPGKGPGGPGKAGGKGAGKKGAKQVDEPKGMAGKQVGAGQPKTPPILAKSAAPPQAGASPFAGRGVIPKPPDVVSIDPDTAREWALIAFADIIVFFGVLMVGFAYLWKRGDIDWVRSTAAESEPLPTNVATGG